MTFAAEKSTMTPGRAHSCALGPATFSGRDAGIGRADPGAFFREAVEPHVPRLVSIARRILGSADLAWDAVQEALIGLWNAGPLPPEPGRWLVRAVVHRSLHASRTERRRRRHERCACCERSEVGSRLDPAALLDRREIVERVEKALGMLPREQRDVLVRRLVDGMDYDSISRRLGIPIGTVRSRINRGRAALCRLLDCVDRIDSTATTMTGTGTESAALGY